MKLIQFIALYEIPVEYKYIAFNREGVLCGFTNAPVRDFKNGQWVDSVTGSTGEMILFDKWDQSCREVSTLSDMHRHPPQCRKADEKRKQKASLNRGESR